MGIAPRARREQARLKGRVLEEDTEEWQKDPHFSGLERVGGVDLSYIKGDESRACASLVVLSYPALQVPPGGSLLAGFGTACHLGVLTDLPCIGVAKNLLHVDGLVRDELHREQVRSLQRSGEAFPLTGTSGKVLGMVLRSYNNSSKPLYVSVGHRVSLDTAVRLVRGCCRFRIPEPIRQVRPLGGAGRLPACSRAVPELLGVFLRPWGVPNPRGVPSPRAVPRPLGVPQPPGVPEVFSILGVFPSHGVFPGPGVSLSLTLPWDGPLASQAGGVRTVPT
uniref:Endonuclease V n=1 Tax=Zosterops lateralis melanops TaxID=1220523 RepID=A0A8D2NSE6_ZOSLA